MLVSLMRLVGVSELLVHIEDRREAVFSGQTPLMQSFGFCGRPAFFSAPKSLDLLPIGREDRRCVK